MKFSPSLIAVPILVLTTACSSHYSASGHHGHRSHHRSHVSVHGHGHGSDVLGALIVGGIIGHVLTEASKESRQPAAQPVTRQENDELVNGYPIKSQPKVEKNAEQSRYYQLGDDGQCYLMDSNAGNPKVISVVPPFSCQ